MSEKTVEFILCAILVLLGWFGHALLYPQNPTKEVVVERHVEVVKEVPTSEEVKYTTCVQHAKDTLYSNWNGRPFEGVTPKSIQEFITNCFEQVNQPRQ